MPACCQGMRGQSVKGERPALSAIFTLNLALLTNRRATVVLKHPLGWSRASVGPIAPRRGTGCVFTSTRRSNPDVCYTLAVHSVLSRLLPLESSEHRCCSLVFAREDESPPSSVMIMLSTMPPTPGAMCCPPAQSTCQYSPALASVPTPKGPRLGFAKRWLGRRASMREQCGQEKHLMASGWKDRGMSGSCRERKILKICRIEQ